MKSRMWARVNRMIAFHLVPRRRLLNDQLKSHPKKLPGVEKSDLTLPTKRIAYAFAVGLQLAQHVELNLRAIIHTLDYHGWIEQLPPEQDQPSQFKNGDEFI